VSVATGKGALTYSLETLQARGKTLFLGHGDECTKGIAGCITTVATTWASNPTKG